MRGLRVIGARAGASIPTWSRRGGAGAADGWCGTPNVGVTPKVDPEAPMLVIFRVLSAHLGVDLRKTTARDIGPAVRDCLTTSQRDRPVQTPETHPLPRTRSGACGSTASQHHAAVRRCAGHWARPAGDRAADRQPNRPTDYRRPGPPAQPTNCRSKKMFAICS